MWAPWPTQVVKQAINTAYNNPLSNIPFSNKIIKWKVPQIASVSDHYGHGHNTFVDQTGVSYHQRWAIGICGTTTDTGTPASVATLSASALTDGILTVTTVTVIPTNTIETCHLPLARRLDWIVFDKQ